jgi:hypothetical protein
MFFFSASVVQVLVIVILWEFDSPRPHNFKYLRRSRWRTASPVNHRELFENTVLLRALDGLGAGVVPGRGAERLVP